MSTEDPTDLQGQERQAEARQRETLSDAVLEAEDFKWLMGSKRGRRIVWRLLEKTRVYQDSMTGNSHTFYNEGRRSIGLMLMAQINENCLPEYIMMLNERTKR